MAGCTEHQLLTADKRIDAEVAGLFQLLSNNAARERLTQAQSAWLTYRNDDCLSQSDIYESGTEATVEDGICLVADDGARSAESPPLLQGNRTRKPSPATIPVGPGFSAVPNTSDVATCVGSGTAFRAGRSIARIPG
jgi:hypothetical protein